MPAKPLAQCFTSPLWSRDAAIDSFLPQMIPDWGEGELIAVYNLLEKTTILGSMKVLLAINPSTPFEEVVQGYVRNGYAISALHLEALVEKHEGGTHTELYDDGRTNIAIVDTSIDSTPGTRIDIPIAIYLARVKATSTWRIWPMRVGNAMVLEPGKFRLITRTTHDQLI